MSATNNYCLNCDGENAEEVYDNICYECYIMKYPNLDTGIEEYTDEEEEEEDETEWEFRVRVGAIKQED